MKNRVKNLVLKYNQVQFKQLELGTQHQVISALVPVYLVPKDFVPFNRSVNEREFDPLFA
jgi:hypothetical protein